ncbi:MAG: winged helix-turn-helix domain-containing protein, partial [Acidobacteriota bacterium]
LLVYLSTHAGRVVPRDELLREVWNGAFVQEAALSRGVSELRRRLGDDPKQPRLIETVPKRGYRCIGRVMPLSDAPLGAVRTAKESPKADLEEEPSRVAAPAAVPSSRRRYRRVVGILALLVAALGLWLWAWTRPEAGSVVVLPLRNLGGDPALDYVCDGLTEDIVARLSRVDGLRVVSRPPRSRSGRPDEDLDQARGLARRLRVASVLDGSVRRQGDAARIVVQVVDAASGRHLWADTYDRDLQDILDLQREVSERVAEALKQELTSSDLERLRRADTGELTAYDLYLRGRQRYRQHTRADNDAAARYYRSALELDPAFALAHAGLANAEGLRAANYGGGEDAAQVAEASARRALELDPQLPEGHKALGLALSQLGQPRRALEAYRRALELRPDYDDAIHNTAFLVYQLGEWDVGGRWQPRGPRERPLR